jgi:superoxide reductase
MVDLKELLQSGDWKTEKHAAVIEVADKVKKGEFFKVTAGVGKEIAHPNKAEHHIGWIAVYFLPRGEKFPYQIGKGEFSAHGASVQGADTSTVYTQHEVTLSFKTDKPGLILAVSYCNIHGLWQSSKELTIE